MCLKLTRLRATDPELLGQLLARMPEFHGDTPVDDAVAWFAQQGYELSQGALRLLTKHVVERLTDEERLRLEERQRQQKELESEFELRYESTVRRLFFAPTQEIRSSMAELPPDSPEAEAMNYLLSCRGDTKRLFAILADRRKSDRKFKSDSIELSEVEIKLLRENPTVRFAYMRSDSVATKKVLARLKRISLQGRIGAALFQAQKTSARAKRYRGGIFNGRGTSYRSLSYGRKSDSLNELCRLLSDGASGLTWGCGSDEENEIAPHVLYLDLPNGQVSFHSETKFDGPDYPGEWDASHDSECRIIEFCEAIIANENQASVDMAERTPK